MGMLKFEVPNSLPVEEARKRVEALLDYWNRKYKVASSWAGEKASMSGRVMGITVDGWLSVLTEKVGGEAADPGLLLRGQAQKYLTRKFAEYLDPKKSLDEVKQGED